MASTRQWPHFTATAISAAALSAAFSLDASPAGARAAPQPELGDAAVVQESADPAEAFGFAVGEERRYGLARPEVLEPGEIESWTARLVGIEAREGGGYTAYFELGYESKRFARRGNILNPDETDHSETEIRLWVNEYGFPLRLESSFTHSHYAVSDQRFLIVFDEDRFIVNNEAAMSYRRIEVPVPNRSSVDLSMPRGVFLDVDVHPALLSLPYAVLFDGREATVEYVSLTPPSAAPRRARGRAYFGNIAIGVGNPGRIALGNATMNGDKVELGNDRYAWVGNNSEVLWWPSPAGFWARLLRPSEY